MHYDRIAQCHLRKRLDGLDIFGDSQGNKVVGNRIGTTANSTGALGNDIDGVSTAGSTASNNSIGDGTSAGANTIAFNGNDGVDISGGTGNAISRNSLFSNGGLGIDLSDGVEDAAGKTTIKGTLDSPPFADLGYTIQFFSYSSGTNEGKKFIGQKLVKTDGSGNTTFTFSPASAVAVGQTITATATILRGSDTSEFSAARKVASS